MKRNTDYLKWIMVCFSGVVFASTMLADQTPARGPYYQEKEEKSKKKFSLIEEKALKELEQLSDWCEKNSFNYERQRVAQTMLIITPENDGAKKLLEGNKVDEKVLPLEKRVQFANEFHKTCRKFSKQYSDIAKWCKSQKLEEAKEQALDVALKLDPENKAARGMRTQAYINGYGWLDVETAKKIVSGKREFNGEWISKGKRDALAKDWKNAWELKSEHFTLKTNTSEEEGLEMLAIAEELYDMFTCEVGRYIEVKDSPNIPINYYATKADYASNIPGEDREKFKDAPGFGGGGSVHFRKDILYPRSCLRHEVTHELCDDRIIGACGMPPPSTPGFWLVEGIATLMEPGWEKEAPGVHQPTLPNIERKPSISKLAVGDFVPLSDFTVRTFSYTLEEYAQAYVLTHYLFTAESAKYRIGLCRLIAAVYSGKADENTFENVIGVKPSDLDTKVREHAQKLSPPTLKK